MMVSRTLRVAPLALAFALVVSPFAATVTYAANSDGSTTYQVEEGNSSTNDSPSGNSDYDRYKDDPSQVFEDAQKDADLPDVSPTGIPHLDTRQESDDPIIQRDESKDLGEYLKGGTIDDEAAQRGFAAAHPIANVASTIAGWIVAILVGTLALFNALGLFYVAVPIGFLRKIMSGGAYGTSGSPNGMGAGMGMGGPMGGFGGMRGGMGMGMGAPMGGMGASATTSSGGSSLANFRIVPDSAIKAVQLAESGATGGAAMTMPGSMGVPGMQQGGSAQPVRPIPYYLKAQLIDMVLIGFAVVTLVLSSVFFDTGIDLANAFTSIFKWALSYVI